ncbi:MAG: FAD-binding protein [Candidatus Thermoplasmatota archaeon]|nr:FAD-binding protein [Candidatus Thermoplasmatota archaeon]
MASVLPLWLKYERRGAHINSLDVGRAQGDSMSEWSAKNPYESTVTVNHILNGEGSRKETRHVVFDLGDSGLTYKAGDALGVIPVTSLELVEDVIVALGADADEIVETHAGETTLLDALSNHCEIHQANRKFVASIGNKFEATGGPTEIRIVKRVRTSVDSGHPTLHWAWSGDDDDYPEGYNPIVGGVDPAFELWKSLSSDDKAMEDYLWGRDYIDVLNDFGHLGFSGQDFVDQIGRLKPRLYSIASSPEFEPGTVHLTIAIVRYEGQGREKTGLTTGYLADRVPEGTSNVRVFMSPTRSFILPEDGSKDIIMVGPGTGIAPFRAFLQQRKADGATGRNWLFFGDWTEEGEFLYRDEIGAYVEDGTIDKLDLAWSREGPEKVYVQHLMAGHGEEIWEWIDNGGYFYVCGDKNRMARDVHSTLINICIEHGGLSEEDAKQFVEQTLMREEKRYLRDVY